MRPLVRHRWRTPSRALHGAGESAATAGAFTLRSTAAADRMVVDLAGFALLEPTARRMVAALACFALLGSRRRDRSQTSVSTVDGEGNAPLPGGVRAASVRGCSGRVNVRTVTSEIRSVGREREAG